MDTVHGVVDARVLASRLREWRGLGNYPACKLFEVITEKISIMAKKEEIVIHREIVIPFSHPDQIIPAWEAWINYKREEFKFKYKSIYSQQAGITHLYNLSGGSEETARHIILQSMANGWQGLFRLRDDYDKTIKKQDTNEQLKKIRESLGFE